MEYFLKTIHVVKIKIFVLERETFDSQMDCYLTLIAMESSLGQWNVSRIGFRMCRIGSFLNKKKKHQFLMLS
jgi:hypothetical protein